MDNSGDETKIFSLHSSSTGTPQKHDENQDTHPQNQQAGSSKFSGISATALSIVDNIEVGAAVYDHRGEEKVSISLVAARSR